MVNYVFFIMCHGKGICPTLLGICNGCVVRYIIGFDVGGPSFKFGLFTIGLGNLGCTIGLCQALMIIMVLNPIKGKEKLIGVLCLAMWKLEGIAQLFPSSNVSI
jgi:hypothetical protein